MGQRTLVPDAGEVVLHELKADGQNRLVMVLRSAGEEGRCPECGRPSRRVHSRYKRQLSDLPWEEIPVRIELGVRRFFCTEDDCAQHIFTERLPNTVSRHSRRTCRLSAALNQITLARWADLRDHVWRNNLAFWQMARPSCADCGRGAAHHRQSHYGWLESMTGRGERASVTGRSSAISKGAK